MFPVTTIVVKGEETNQRDANALRIIMSRQEKMSLKAVGSNPNASKEFFSHKTSVKGYLRDHLVLDFVHYLSMSPNFH